MNANDRKDYIGLYVWREPRELDEAANDAWYRPRDDAASETPESVPVPKPING